MTTGYKKYMKKNSTKDYGLLKLFIISFFGMLLVFTFLIKTLTPSVDVSIGGDRPEPEIDNSEEMKKIVDGRLAMIQDEDQGKNFSDLMKRAEDIKMNRKLYPAQTQKILLQKLLKHLLQILYIKFLLEPILLLNKQKLLTI